MEKALEQDPVNIVKIVLFGPESSGKTTLSKKLAKQLKYKYVDVNKIIKRFNLIESYLKI